MSAVRLAAIAWALGALVAATSPAQAGGPRGGFSGGSCIRCGTLAIQRPIIVQRPIIIQRPVIVGRPFVAASPFFAHRFHHRRVIIIERPTVLVPRRQFFSPFSAFGAFGFGVDP